MIYLDFDEVIRLHKRGVSEYGGTEGIRDEGALLSAIAQPEAGFGGIELHPTLAEKAAMYCWYITKNHPFLDGNKRAGALAMILMLYINGYQLKVNDDENEAVVLRVATNTISREEFASWVSEHVEPLL